MAAEYDHITIPAGSMAIISDHEGNDIASGTLLEEYTISLDSKFGQLVDSGADNAFTVLGGALKSMTSGKFGFSSTFKQAGFVHWQGTEPAQIQFSLEFHYSYDAFEEVVSPVRRLCKLPLPGEGGIAGTLVPPGPSVLEAISGPKTTNMPPKSEGASPVDIDEDRTKKTADSYVNIRLGNMCFMECVVMKVEPTYSRFVDEGNFPIYARVMVNAQTMYTATKENIDFIMKRGL